MSFRTWLFALAIGIVVAGLAWFSWSGFSTYKQNHANERNDAAQYYANATQEGVNSCRSIVNESGFIDWLNCLAENISADSGVKQAEYDLKAQQDMAVWAFGMLIATIWVAVITLIGVAFVGWTLFATTETLKAARKTNSIMANSERPWVICWGLFAAYRDDIDPGTGARIQAVNVAIAMKNVGRSPAVNASMMTSVKIDHPMAFPELPDPYVKGIPVVLGPDGDAIGHSFWLNEEKAHAILSGKSAIFLRTSIVYKSADGAVTGEFTHRARYMLRVVTDPAHAGVRTIDSGQTPYSEGYYIK